MIRKWIKIYDRHKEDGKMGEDIYHPFCSPTQDFAEYKKGEDEKNKLVTPKQRGKHSHQQ